MPTESVQITLVRLEAKVDKLVAVLDEKHDKLVAVLELKHKDVDRRLDSLESSRAKVISWIAAIVGTMLVTGITAIAHIR